MAVDTPEEMVTAEKVWAVMIGFVQSGELTPASNAGAISSALTTAEAIVAAYQDSLVEEV